GIVADPVQRAVVAAIIDLGHVLGLQLIAEGVETEDQRMELEELGCDRGQGYLWARPLDLEALTAYLANERAALDAASPDELDQGLSAALRATGRHRTLLRVNTIGSFAREWCPLATVDETRRV